MDILKIDNLNISFKVQNTEFYAVSDLSLNIKKKEILGIVGESGCGKSMTALSVIDLLPEAATREVNSIVLNGNDITELNKKEMRSIRGKEVSMIFQEPMTSLNPLIKVGRQIIESVKIHSSVSTAKAKKEVYDIMKAVGLPDVENLYNRYPHELSGGMRQRIMIAMAMVLRPKLLIADEPTTALDVTIQAQILELMKKLNKEFSTTIMFISHDFGVIKQMCDTIMVMYMGYVVEKAPSNEILKKALHPYTKGMINSIPNPKNKDEELYSIKGSVPSIKNLPTGCPFSPRCEKAQDICYKSLPETRQVDENHMVRCHLV